MMGPLVSRAQVLARSALVRTWSPWQTRRCGTSDSRSHRGVAQARAHLIDPGRHVPPLSDEVVALMYELLDAHYDTARLAEDLRREQVWCAHLDYLRALQCVGREVLAQSAMERAR